MFREEGRVKTCLCEGNRKYALMATDLVRPLVAVEDDGVWVLLLGVHLRVFDVVPVQQEEK